MGHVRSLQLAELVRSRYYGEKFRNMGLAFWKAYGNTGHESILYWEPRVEFSLVVFEPDHDSQCIAGSYWFVLASVCGIFSSRGALQWSLLN